MTPVEHLLPAALVVFALFPLALVAEWGLLSVILRAMTPNPRAGRTAPGGVTLTLSPSREPLQGL